MDFTSKGQFAYFSHKHCTPLADQSLELTGLFHELAVPPVWTRGTHFSHGSCHELGRLLIRAGRFHRLKGRAQKPGVRHLFTMCWDAYAGLCQQDRLQWGLNAT